MARVPYRRTDGAGKMGADGAEALASYSPEARFGGGSNSTLPRSTDSTRPLKVLDLVSYSINPQVHSFDIPALVENLEAQAMTVESARPIIGNRPLAISPVTLRPRFSASATGPELPPPPGTLPFAVDPGRCRFSALDGRLEA